MNPAAAGASAPSHWRRLGALYALLAVCLTPVLASYTVYYFLPPGGRTNFGDLIEPQRPLPALVLRQPDGQPFDLGRLRGQWLMVAVDAGACSTTCQKKLWQMRQVHATQGRERTRVERVLLLLDDAVFDPALVAQHEGMLVLRAQRAQLATYFALPATPGADLADHLWLIDPLGNQMLRWPADPDPSRMKKDLGKLLKASRIG